MTVYDLYKMSPVEISSALNFLKTRTVNPCFVYESVWPNTVGSKMGWIVLTATNNEYSIVREDSVKNRLVIRADGTTIIRFDDEGTELISSELLDRFNKEVLLCG